MSVNLTLSVPFPRLSRQAAVIAMAAASPMLYAPPPALDQNPFPASSLPEGQPPLSPLQQWVPTPEGLLEKLKRNRMTAGKVGKGGGAASGAAGGGLPSDADDATAAEAAEERLGVGMPVLSQARPESQLQWVFVAFLGQGKKNWLL
eukprot:s1969_g4.t1